MDYLVQCSGPTGSVDGRRMVGRCQGKQNTVKAKRIQEMDLPTRFGSKTFIETGTSRKEVTDSDDPFLHDSFKGHIETPRCVS